MSDTNDKPHDPGRRRLLGGAALAAAAVAATPATAAAARSAHAGSAPATLAFFGKHQAGITTPMQRHSYFMAFDLVSTRREDVIALLKAWTAAAAVMTQAPEQAPRLSDPEKIPEQSGDTIGIAAARLSITFGFGPGLFEKDGIDRYGLA